MRTNGSFRYLLTTDEARFDTADGEQVVAVKGGILINEHGEPIATKQSWSEPIKCSIQALSDNRKGKYEDGVFRQASFQILIEQGLKEDISRISLTMLGEEIGEYDVISVSPILSQGRIQIVV